MKISNPVLGLILIALGLVAIVVFAVLHIDQVTIAIGIVTLGIAIMQSIGHQSSNAEVKVLRASMRPPPSPPPSLVDEMERIQSLRGPKESQLSLPPSGDPDKVRGK
jgi:hypothetical protein